MADSLKVIATLLGAVVGAAVAPTLIFYIGYGACSVVAWLSGNEHFMGYMWLVVALCILGIPAGLVAGAWMAYSLAKMVAARFATPTGRGFSVAQAYDDGRAND